MKLKTKIFHNSLQNCSLRADVSYFLPPAEKGRLGNGVANRVPVSCCFSGIRGKCFYWLLDNSHC